MKTDILRYLNGPYEQGGINYKSAYMSALIDARRITGRDEDTGKIINPQNTGCWAGALIYLVLIEHIGNMFILENIKCDRNPFITALKSFSDLNQNDRYALYALRCSFAHDYFLFNIPSSKDKNRNLLIHHFALMANSFSPLIRLPDNNWDGQFNNTNKITIVNLEKLGDLVENIHLKLINICKDDELKIIDGKEEFLGINYVQY